MIRPSSQDAGPRAAGMAMTRTQQIGLLLLLAVLAALAVARALAAA